jgi:hypothetical protein
MSTNKVSRLLRALSNESVKRLPYIFFVLIVISLIQFVRLGNQTAQGVQIAKDNSLDGKALLKKVADLAQDNKQLGLQNKKLAEQNIQIANDNAKHLDCLADLFAQYTRTGRPILQLDLNTCMITQGSVGTSATDAQTSAPPSLPNPSVQSSLPQSNTNSQPSPLNGSQTILDHIRNTGSNFLKALGL